MTRRRIQPEVEAGFAKIKLVSAPGLNLFEDSLMVSSSGAVATGLMCNMIPDRDVSRVWGATNSEATGLFTAPFAMEMVLGGEVIKRLTQAQREVNSTHQSFDEVMEHHTELEMQLADLEVSRAEEGRAAEAQKEVLEAQVKRLMAEKKAPVIEKEALVTEKRVIGAELEALLVKKTAVEVEFDETKARAEEEHPAPFLSVTWALDEQPDDEEEADEEDDEEDDEGATPPSSPKP
ncbi:myosin-6 [Dorcoceras hygrometricum]|uniref:Myosin-6 n=1 Tax=Dorcoceras hygrometricum TaxID=472368 RepID=A0A2Z7DCY9_9LAMI|nr:myosin-6 [Dorcoceras hygrometricum]